MASTAHELQSIWTMRALQTPFGLNAMRPKGAKGAIPQAPTLGGHQSGPPIHEDQKCPRTPNWSIPSKGPIKQEMASRSNQRPTATFSSGSTSKRETLSQLVSPSL
ncbi:hypothetical protein O181_093306 [Austropuccinia psidii MF-1]|uniref:Uncharacterized protein n=1 Tax=Austropuccinia psidii MF-1 TaxID=1389203 RepID=A0A9Q3J184_9BASI|nr:hypothetical protein [Austropuccinia psidii MF-1]